MVKSNLTMAELPEKEMPLLHKKPFVREPIPPNLQPDDPIFYCKVTGEVFTDYEKFFERVILCNSLVWSCSLTGRTGLTFQEVTDSEGHARKRLQDFPQPLQIPVLLLMTLTRRRRLIDACYEIHSFIDDRYFVGESVFAVLPSGARTLCTVENVVSSNGIEKTKSGSMSDAESDDSDVICLDDEPKSVEPPVRAGSQSIAVSSPGDFHYTLRFGEDLHVIAAKYISRKATVFSRERCLLFLRYHCDQDGSGMWKVKESSATSFKLSTMNLSSVFSGPPPSFSYASSSNSKSRSSCKTVSKPSEQLNNSVSSVVIDLTEEEESLKKQKIKTAKTRQTKDKKNAKSPDSVAERESLAVREAAAKQQFIERQKLLQQQYEQFMIQKRLEEEAKIAQREEIRKRQEEERVRRKAQIAEERVKKRLEKQQMEERLREWSRPREDMECDDLKELPAIAPVEYISPSSLFGDAVFVLEYLHCFKPLFSFDLPDDLSLKSFVQSLVKAELDGLFTDILRLLLSTIFRLQEDELSFETFSEELKDCLEGWDEESEIKFATSMLQYPLLNYGTSLHKLQIDGATVTEVLRLHLVSSGAKRLPSLVKSDIQQRGCYVSFDDPGLEFCRQNKRILESLKRKSVSELVPGDKLNILTVLIHQLLTFSTSRDWLDENFDRLKNIQKDLRAHQWMEQRRLRDEAQFWVRKRSVEKQKLYQSAMNPSAEQNTSEMNGTPNGPKLHCFSKTLTDDDFENLPAENIDWESLGPENTERMKQWTKQKEKEIAYQASLQQQSIALCPIGRDRYFRRYWVFQSVPGLFVEQYENRVPASNGIHQTNAEGCETETVSNGQHDNSCESSASHCISDSSISVCAKSVWSFYETSESIDQLLVSLNVRGFREGPLRAVVHEQSERLRRWVSQGDALFLKTKWTPTGHNADVNDCSERNLHCILREMILDFEERIYTGSLGHLKVKSREEWRAALLAGGYDSRSKSMNWTRENNGIVKETKGTKRLKAEADAVSLDVDFETEEENALESSIKWDLSRALLQVEQMVEARCRKPPFEAGSSTLGCWESSLMSQPTSLSRIALHMSVLESSIMWSRSAQFARCRICWRRGDAERMLLCDSCDRGHHTYCLKPAMKTIPAGDWFCPTCRMKDVKVTKSKRKVVEEMSSSESASSESSADEQEVTAYNSDDNSKNATNQESTAEQSEDETPTRATRGSKAVKQHPRSSASDSGQKRLLRSRVSDIMNSSRSQCSSPDSTTSSSKSKVLRVTVNLGNHSKHRVTYNPASDRLSLDTAAVSKRKVLTDRDEDAVPKKAAKGSTEDQQLAFKTCEDLLSELIQKDEAWPFRRPVGRREAPGYHDIVRQPMDLSTVQSKLLNGSYEITQQVVDDIRLILSNCSLYYSSPTSPERLAGQKLARHLERRVRELRLNACSESQSSKTVSSHKPSTRSRKKTV